jgi:pyroglutamyl-peptidase
MKVLVTGFDPFGGEKTNPAYESIQLIEEIKDIELIKIEIPTVFYESKDVLEKAIEKHMPDMVICVGQAGGRSHISLERVAINVDDGRIPDNKGQQPIDEKISEEGPVAYFTNLPIKAMVEALKEAGIPGTVSNSAGTYVCNHIMYQLMHLIENKYPHIKGGFIHVPFCEAQVVNKGNMPSMNLKRIADGLKVCIITAASVKEDVKKTGGSIC